MDGRTARRARFWGLLALALVVAIPTLPGVTLAAPVGAPAPTVATGAPSVDGFPSFYGGSFAQRAGYSSAVPGEVSDPLVYTGSALVAITFAARDPSFFATPSAGAAPLTSTQVASRWGLPVAAYAAAEAYFVADGLTVVHTASDRLSLTVSGSAAALDRAFGTRLESGEWDGRTVTFPAASPTLPVGLENEIVGISGLSTGMDSFSLPLVPTSPAASATDMVTPAIARQIYDLSSLYNVSGGAAQFPSGEAIALLLWGDGYAPSDISTFFSSYYPSSFPAVHWNAYPVDGAPAPSAGAPNDPSGAPRELTLDMEWSGSMAPGATLDAVYAPDGPSSNGYSPTDVSMIDALNEAISLPDVRAVSMSFGTSESTDAGLSAGFETAFATATQEGISLLAATGDTGGDAKACSGGPAPEYPSTSPYVLAVGGTDVSLSRNVIGSVTGFSESGWVDSGGGFSSDYSTPSWQSSVPTIAAQGHRGVPDVAATAALNFLYFDGQTGQGAGTSFATPLWAGLVVTMDARAGTSLGFLNPRIYVVAEEQSTGKNGIGLMDITSGSNCVATATTGWDAVTGWGSPSALLLYEDLTATFVNITVTASPATVAPGGTVTIQVTLANRTSGAPVVGVPAEIDLDADSAVGPCVGRFATATVSSNAQGVATASLAVPACYLGSHAIATVTVTSDGLYGQSSTTLAVNLLGLVPALGFLGEMPYSILGFVVIMGLAIALGGVLGRRPPRRPSVASAPAPPAGANAPVAAPSVPAAGPPASPAAAPVEPTATPPAEAPPGPADPEPFDMGSGR